MLFRIHKNWIKGQGNVMYCFKGKCPGNVESFRLMANTTSAIRPADNPNSLGLLWLQK